MAQKRLIAGLFRSLGLMHQRALTRVPTQITCQIFKERTGPHQGPVVDSARLAGAASSRALPRALKGAGSIALSDVPSTLGQGFNSPPRLPRHFKRRGLRGARSIATAEAVSNGCHEYF